MLPCQFSIKKTAEKITFGINLKFESRNYTFQSLGTKLKRTIKMTLTIGKVDFLLREEVKMVKGKKLLKV